MGANMSSNQVLFPEGLKGMKPLNDPLYGWPEGRKERPKPKATVEEMDAAHLAPWQRDYCVDYLLELCACKRRNIHWPLACRHERHHWHDCQFQDNLLRSLERERERRLVKRERRLAGVEERPFWLLEMPVKIWWKFGWAQPPLA